MEDGKEGKEEKRWKGKWDRGWKRREGTDERWKGKGMGK